MTEIEKQPLTSMDVTKHQLQKLKEIFPEVFSEGSEKPNWEKLRLTLGEDLDIGKERFGLNWHGKADCFKVIQQPSIATLVPAKDESIDFDTTQNIFIEGDNLEVLKLLQKSYLGKVKMIYIDPPYNTGKKFIYPDKYAENLQTYLEYTGQVDSKGRKFTTNTETDGRFHYKWLNMMYPRLFLARNLLKDDGVIFISIDDNEIANLRLLMDEIFGEENFVGIFVWKKKQGGGNDSKYMINEHENIISFAKCKNEFKFYLDTDIELGDSYSNKDEKGEFGLVTLDKSSIRFSNSLVFDIIDNDGNIYKPRIIKGKQSCWRWSKTKVDKEFDKLVFKNGKVYTKFYRPEGIVPKSLLIEDRFGRTATGKLNFAELFNENIFDYPKPVKLIRHFLKIGSNSDSLILDFFAGSCTTAHAVMELNKEDGGNRKFICVQLPEPTAEDSEAFKAGYETIAEVSKERIRRVSKKLKEEDEKDKEKNLLFKSDKAPLDLGFKVFKLKPSNFRVWDGSISKEPEAKQDAILFELLLKAGFELDTPIENLKLEGKDVYSISNGELLICLDKELNYEAIKAMAELKPTRVICLDEGFQNNDELKTNAVQIMKTKGVVNFRTV